MSNTSNPPNDNSTEPQDDSNYDSNYDSDAESTTSIESEEFVHSLGNPPWWVPKNPVVEERGATTRLIEPEHTTETAWHAFKPSDFIHPREAVPAMDPYRRCAAPGEACAHATSWVGDGQRLVLTDELLVSKCVGHEDCTGWWHWDCYQRSISEDPRETERATIAKKKCRSDKHVYRFQLADEIRVYIATGVWLHSGESLYDWEFKEVNRVLNSRI